ncbi:hypothetical protein [uncultured Anaerococcus sp.]|uniref:hypothetical protein n=1 Tax=uncultured Anaerococcus sp. TaxID=293428 RepID=UPI0025CD2AB6|nr:hypothetical protein [uncultured Anaerococcus sp.]
MIVSKYEAGLKTRYEVSKSYDLKKISETRVNFESVYSLSLKNDRDYEKLKLLAILSPILIASFDNGNIRLNFLEETIKKSTYPYGLYPNIFDNFRIGEYLKAYESLKRDEYKEDIILREDMTLDFYFNPMPDPLLKSLVVMIDTLVEDYENRKILLNYFNKMRDDIVRNGRRSIMANGIQAFYLNKYIVVWMLDLIDFINKKNPGVSSLLDPIEDLVNNLKTPADIK